MPTLLSCHKIIKRYGHATVLDCEHFAVEAGEIHALLGANGAGKSTLCRILAGLLPPDEATMQLAGIEYRPANKQAAEAKGVEIVQQELNLIATLSVAENLFLTRLPHRGGWLRRHPLRTQARAALERFGLGEIDPDLPMGRLGVGQQQMIEIAAALNRSCRLLILDEPTAALSSSEAAKLFEHLRDLRRQGVGIIIITHRLDEVLAIADRVTILRDGRHVCTESIDSLTSDQMIEWMSGTQPQRSTDFHSHLTPRCLMEVEKLSGGRVRDVSFRLHAGQRLGIAGLVGSGRTELLRLIFGADRAESGAVWLHRESAEERSEPSQSQGKGGVWLTSLRARLLAKPAHLLRRPKPPSVGRRFHHPGQAVAAGLAMVTEDRKQNGLLLTQSIRCNSTLNSLASHFSRWGLVRGVQECQAVDEMIAALEIKCQNREQAVLTLSGGNQQKVAIARWLLREADIFFFDEPTRGIDIAARRRIYRLFDSLAEAGKGLVIVSSDLEELLETCDHIGVMSAGRWAGLLDRNSASRQRIMQAAFSGYQATEVIAHG